MGYNGSICWRYDDVCLAKLQQGECPLLEKGSLTGVICVGAPGSVSVQDDTNKQRREDREKNLRIAKDVRRQAEDKSGEERDALLLKAQTFFQKVR